MKNKAILFDLFGTLCGATSPEWECIKRFKLAPEIHDKLQRAVCGFKFTNWKNYLDNLIQTLGIENSLGNKKILREIINSELENRAIKIPEGRDEVLTYLSEREYKLAIVSNSYPPTRQKVIAEGCLDKFFKYPYIILSYEIGITKQSPEIYLEALKRLNVKAENSIMIGDSLKGDIISSKNATNGKIGGILISSKQQDKKANKIENLVVVPYLKQVPEAIENHFYN